MKNVYTLFVMFFVLNFISSAQYITCQSMPLAHGIPYTSSFSGDTLIVTSITNNSGTNFAYPLAKIFPVTPLPPGMTESGGMGGWNVFGSSWNDGQTNDAPVSYNVTIAIPADYMFSYILRVSNFLPLSIDSCYFTDTITVNLNPSSSGMFDLTTNVSTVTAFPNPTNDFLNLVSNDILMTEIQVKDVSGKLIQRTNVNSKYVLLNISAFVPGIYICQVQLENGQRAVRRLVIER
jgi:hypothetical protein